MWESKKYHIYTSILCKKKITPWTHPPHRFNGDNPLIRVQLLGRDCFPKPPRYLDGVSFSDRLFWLFLTESVVFKGTSSLWLGVKWKMEVFGFGWTMVEANTHNKQTSITNNKENKENNKQQTLNNNKR